MECPPLPLASNPNVADLDLLLLVDPRLAPAEARALGRLIDVLAVREWQIGLLAIRSALPTRGRQFDLMLTARIDADRLHLVDSDERVCTRLLLVWHIAPMLGVLDRPPRIAPGHAILRFDQVPWLGDAPDAAVLATVRRCFATTAGAASTEEIAADPGIAAWLGLGGDCWFAPVLPTGRAARAKRDAVPTVGRHGGLGAAAWPMDGPGFVRAYPAGPGLRVDLLGPPLKLLRRRIEQRLPQLRLLPDGSEDLPTFLARLELWHLAGWPSVAQPVAAEVLEAAACATPLSLPRQMTGWPADAATFHGGALPDPGEDCTQQVGAALEFVHAHATPGHLADRLERRAGLRAKSAGRLPPAHRSRRTVLMVSPNGVGMGHLTRLLAVARRLPGKIEPIFLTMSQAVAVVRQYGFHGEYLPYHSYYGGDPDYWNRGLLARLQAMIGFFDPRVVLFDGNVPYAALADLRKQCLERRFVWLRRGLWRPESGKLAIERAGIFDMVIEPGEFAAEADRGLTRTRSGEVVRVAPVTLLDDDEILDRERARIDLAIPAAAFAIVVLLGSQNNYDYGQIRSTIAKRFCNRPDVVMVEAEWLISENNGTVVLPGARRLSGFPMARLFKAFDLAISATGYNSFHELLSMGIPTIFVPNEHPSMDEQEARAAWAERQGLGIAIRAHQQDRLSWALDAMQDRAVAVRMRANARHLPATDGAAAIARLIEAEVVARDVLTPPLRLPHLAPHSAPLVE